MAFWNRRSDEIRDLREQVASMEAAAADRGVIARDFEATTTRLAELSRLAVEAADGPEREAVRSQIAGVQSRLTELRSRGIGESRAIGGFPWIEDNPAVPFASGGPAHPSQVVMGVDHALRLAPVYAAARLLADGVASLPIVVYVPDRNGNTQKYKGPTIFNSTPDQGPLGQGPSVTGTIYDWVHTCMTSLVLEGNAFGYIATRDGFGFPTTIEWMAPKLVWIDEDDTSSGIPNPLRARYYYEGRLVPREDMFHIRAFTVAGRTRGVSPLRHFATLIHQGNAMLKYGADWFDSGGFPPGVFRNTVQEVDEDNAGEIKGRLVAAIRRRQPLVIGADWTYEHVTVPPSESQFVEAMQLNATQVGAIYGVPPNRIGGLAPSGTLRYSNVEAEQIAFITDTLRPWLVRLECAFYGLLPGSRYARFNADALIKTDVKTRHEVYQIDRQMGMKPIDELRRLDDLEPLAGDVGKDNIPLLLAADLARSGKAVPNYMADEITVLETPPGATPGVPATQESETPQPDEKSQTGTPDTAPAANGNAPAGARPPARRPATAPAPSGTPRSSVADVAAEWAGACAADPARFRAFLAEAGMAARRHGIAFSGYTDAVLDERQAGWLLGFCRATGDPQPSGINHANGRVRTRS